MKAFVLRAAMVALALGAVPGAVRASWVAGTGGSVLVSSPANTADGVINYAVYKNDGAGVSGGNLFTQLGIAQANDILLGGSAANYQTRQYAYVYQVVNTQYNTALEAPLDAIFIQANMNNVSGIATASTGGATPQGYVFTEAGGNKIGASGGILDPTGGNNRLDGGAAENHTNSAPVVTTGQPDGTAVDAGAWLGDPNMMATWNFFPDNSGNVALRVDFGLANRLSTNAYTTLIIVTSDFAPVTGGLALQDGGNANGLGPVPTPEPGTLALLGLGLPLLGWGYVRRLRANKAVVAAVTA